MKKIIYHFILIFFLTISTLITFIYLALVVEKIMRPEFKNASLELLIASGVLVLGFVVCDFYILKYFFRMPKKTSNGEINNKQPKNQQ